MAWISEAGYVTGNELKCGGLSCHKFAYSDVFIRCEPPDNFKCFFPRKNRSLSVLN